jgi:hypothetical protein
MPSHFGSIYHLNRLNLHLNNVLDQVHQDDNSAKANKYFSDVAYARAPEAPMNVRPSKLAKIGLKSAMSDKDVIGSHV